MRYFILILFILAGIASRAQSTGESPLELIKASDAYIPSPQSPGMADFQASNWKRAVSSNPANADAWLNYYIWTDRTMEYVPERQETLGEMVQDAAPHITNTYQYHLMRFLQSDKKDSNAVFTALNLARNRQEVYPYIIHYALIKNDRKVLAEYVQKLPDVAADQYRYHRNVLWSADSNATVYARGFNDLVPLAVMQYRHKVRPDVRLKYYEGKVADQAGAYLALSLGKQILQQYPDAAYTGLLVKLQPGDGSELQKHVEHDLDLSDLRNSNAFNLSPVVVQLYRNYFPGFISLYRIYKKNNDPNQASLKAMIQKIANASGDSQAINNLLDQ